MTFNALILFFELFFNPLENVKPLGSIYNQLVLRGINILDIFIVFAERNAAWMPENPFHPNWSHFIFTFLWRLWVTV